MADESLHDDLLAGLGITARRAVARAEAEARRLGHDRVGTEHLLLGLLADDGTTPDKRSTAGAVLADAGLTFAATRHKVREASSGSSGSGPDGTPATSPLGRTARAERAISRAVRFSHVGGADAVRSEDLLLGVLDVEGTAGQVLRGVGIDVDQLRATLDASASTSSATESSTRVEAAMDTSATTTWASPARCPACAIPLDDHLGYRAVTASGEHGDRVVTVYACNACGRFLGLGPG